MELINVRNEISDIDEIFKLQSELKLAEYDLLLIADGSGTVVNNCSAWACISFNPHESECRTFIGTMNCGTNNFAEIIPFVQALWHYEAIRDATRFPKPKVELVSDSEVSVLCGNKKYSRKANSSIWAAIDCFESVGYILHWNHVHRNTNALSKRCDWLAGETRKTLESLQNGLTRPKRRPII
jgi:ribonuclease HI